MSSRISTQRILVTGASGFVGTAVVYALLQSGVQVTAMISPGSTFRLKDADRQALRLIEADVWNRGSLSGRSRGHHAVIHLVGSIYQQPARGLTYHHLNVAATQNIVRMAIGDGVSHFLHLSTSGAPWLPGAYVQSKREAERYIQRSGIRWSVIRAPLTYPRGMLRNPLLIIASLLGAVPVLGWPVSRWAPLPVDILARGLAQIASNPESTGQVIYGRTLRQMSRQTTIPQTPAMIRDPLFSSSTAEPQPDDETPFGWLP